MHAYVRVQKTLWEKEKNAGYHLFSSLFLTSYQTTKIFDWTKLKAFADDKINVNGKLKFWFGRVENIVGKGENAGYQHFLLFPQCFQKSSVFGLL